MLSGHLMDSNCLNQMARKSLIPSSPSHRCLVPSLSSAWTPHVKGHTKFPYTRLCNGSFPSQHQFQSETKSTSPGHWAGETIPMMCGGGKAFFLFYYWLAVVKCRVWFASVAKLVGAVARVWLFCTVLGWKGKKEGMAFSRDLMLAAL